MGIRSRNARVEPYLETGFTDSAQVEIARSLPALLADVGAGGPPGGLAAALGAPVPANPVLYRGCGNQVTPTHFDPDENLLCMVSGAKTVVLRHPADAAFLYPSGDRNANSVFSNVDPRLSRAETAARFPLLAECRPVAVTVRAGDVLYIPTGWWHEITGAPGPNVSVNYWYRLRGDKVAHDALLEEFGRVYAEKRPPAA